MEWSVFWLLVLQGIIAFVIFALPILALAYFLAFVRAYGWISAVQANIAAATAAVKLAMAAKRDKGTHE